MKRLRRSRGWIGLLEAVVSDVRDFIDVQTVYDDLTLVALKRK